MLKHAKVMLMSAVMGTVLLSAGVLHAAIVLDPAFSGTVIVTSPEGEIKIYQPGEPVTAIADNSTVEIFNGDVTVTTEKGDSVNVSCGKASAGVSGGGSAAVSCGEKSGTLKVLTGPVKMLGPDAPKNLLEEGKEYPFGQTGDLAKRAPATADVDDTTGTTPAGDPPVDSRSIQASQSQ